MTFVSLVRCTAAALALFAASAQAAVIEADFKTKGDGLLMVDTVSKRQWVDVTKTAGMSVNYFLNNSMFAGAGFRLATTAELKDFFVSAGAVDIFNDAFSFTSANIPAAALLYGLMEHAAPYSSMNGNSYIHGYIDIGSATNLSLGRIGYFGQNTNGANFDLASNGTSWTRNSVNGAVGVWALREGASNVPEPGSLALTGLALLALAAGRRRKSTAA